MKDSRRGPSAILTFAATLLLLAGCASAQPTGASPDPTRAAPTTAAPTPTASGEGSATPTPDAQAVIVPVSCESLLPADTISDALDEVWYDSEEPVDAASELPGPSARAAAESAETTLSCRWWPEKATEAYLLGYAFGLDENTRVDLVDALDAASTYEQIAVEGADAGFSTSEVRGDLRHTTVYAFVDDVWLAFSAPLFEERLVGFVEDAITRVAAV